MQQSIKNVRDDKPDFGYDDIKNRIINSEANQHANQAQITATGGRATSAIVGAATFNGVCYGCGEYGHSVSHCTKTHANNYSTTGCTTSATRARAAANPGTLRANVAPLHPMCNNRAAHAPVAAAAPGV